MDKYAVAIEDEVKIAEEKLTATAKCGVCGSALEKNTNVPKCPHCGTKPFESKAP